MVVCDHAPHGPIDYLPCLVKNESRCKFITASSKVQGCFRAFIEDENFIRKIICKMPLEV